jgi:hypothetical protein
MADFDVATDSVPLAALPDDVLDALRIAKERVLDRRDGRASGQAERLESARSVARSATEASNRSPSSKKTVERLSVANAELCVIASLAHIDRFPNEVSVEALLPAANLTVSIGRRHQLEGKLEAALDHFSAALTVVRAFRAYSRVASVDQAVYGIAARAGGVVGAIAARRRLDLATTLAALDRNIITVYEGLMTSGDLSAPRAFAAIALLREALGFAVTPDDFTYLRRLRSDIVAAQDDLEPRTENAMRRFRSDLAALRGEVATRLGEEAHAGFTW